MLITESEVRNVKEASADEARAAFRLGYAVKRKLDGKIETRQTGVSEAPDFEESGAQWFIEERIAFF